MPETSSMIRREGGRENPLRHFSWPRRRVLGELVRFVLVGLKSNAVYYMLYVAFTAVSLEAKASATLVFLIGIFYSLLFNRLFVFHGDGFSRFMFLRYVLVYVGAWAVNMLCLELFATHWHFDHRLVQAVLMLVIGFGIFIALKLFVFHARPAEACG